MKPPCAYSSVPAFLRLRWPLNASVGNMQDSTPALGGYSATFPPSTIPVVRPQVIHRPSHCLVVCPFHTDVSNRLIHPSLRDTQRGQVATMHDVLDAVRLGILSRSLYADAHNAPEPTQLALWVAPNSPDPTPRLSDARPSLLSVCQIVQVSLQQGHARLSGFRKMRHDA